MSITATHRLIFKQLAARQEISAFIRWIKGQGYKVSRKTYYRAFEQEARTHTQQLALDLSEQYAIARGYINPPPPSAPAPFTAPASPLPVA